MECICFKEPVIRWFQSYLSNREFLLEIEEKFSDARLMNCGVPQGPLLFLIYINNLPQSLNETGSYLHTDNTCIIKVLKKNCLSLCEWFINNKLSIHFEGDKRKQFISFSQ